MARKINMEMALEKHQGKYLMRDDKVTYELRKYNLSELSQKFLFGIMFKISSDFIKPINEMIGESIKALEYKLSFEDIKELLLIDYRIESDKRKLEKLLKELVSTPITISVFGENKKRKELVNTNLITSTTLSDDKEFIYLTIDERVLPLYKATSDKFTLWGFEYISFTEKKYSPRLYELLIEFAHSIGTKNINGIISKTIDIDDLRYELSIPSSYQYSSNIKRNILEKAKEEFLALDFESEKKREHLKLFQSFNYTENLANRRRTAGRRSVESITFNFELLQRTKGLLIGKKGIQSINPEKLEKRKEVKSEFYYTVGEIIARVENKNLFINSLTNNIEDFTLRVIDIKSDIKDQLNLSEIQDIAFERGLLYTLENLKTSDIEEFEYNFRVNLEKNITYWKNKTGKGKAQLKKEKGYKKNRDGK